jgi:Mg2+ and Co2+ transporter CorA
MPPMPSLGGTLSGSKIDWNTSDALQTEQDFWISLAVEGMVATPQMKPIDASGCSGSPASPASTEMFLSGLDGGESVSFDASPQQIDTLYDSWSREAGRLDLNTLRDRLCRDYALVLSLDKLKLAVERVSGRFGSRFAQRFIDEDGQSRIVFASLWQRLALGACCSRMLGERDESCLIQIIEYAEHKPIKKTFQDENTFLFGGGSRGGRRRPSKEGGATMICASPLALAHEVETPTSRWGCIEGAGKDTLTKIGIKFFLHPLATEDMINAAHGGATKIDRYRHQYFVSLEVYALSPLSGRDTAVRTSEADAPVGGRITRSTMALVATGNPPTRAQPSTSRDWLLSIINDSDENGKGRRDPLDCFCSNRFAARSILSLIEKDLYQRKRLREYQADFLLYSIIDKAAEQLTPIYSAYGHRLRWLQDRLDAGELWGRSLKKKVDEVSHVRLELQELRQWVAQLKSIIRHLENDCGGTNQSMGPVPWSFGTDERGQGKSMLLFLRHTGDDLDLAGERLGLLSDLAQNFAAGCERQKSDFMNQALFVLTISTVMLLPAQFLAGVFGMNFSNMGILQWEHGYLFFWVFSGSLVVFIGILGLIGMRRRRVVCGRTALCCKKKAVAPDGARVHAYKQS